MKRWEEVSAEDMSGDVEKVETVEEEEEEAAGCREEMASSQGLCSEVA